MIETWWSNDCQISTSGISERHKEAFEKNESESTRRPACVEANPEVHC